MKYHKNEEDWQERVYEEQEQCKHNNMENKEQYYTPDISDIYLGYQYQQCTNDYEDIWVDCVVNKEWTPRQAEISIHHGGLIRTKYLSREDIVAEGWIEYNNSRGEMDQPWYVSYRHKNNPNLLLNHTAHINDVEYEKISDTISIYEDYNKPNEAWAYHQKWLYSGKCTSINELRKLQQWLKIK